MYPRGDKLMNTQTNGPPARIPVEAAATYVNLSVSTMNKLRLTGGGPEYSKIGRRVSYSMGALDTWVGLNLRRNTSEAVRA